MGSGRFVSPKIIEVALNDGGARTLAGAEIVLNLGSHAAIPDIPGLAAARPLTHIEALELDCLPTHFIVLGGGYIRNRDGPDFSPLRQPRDDCRALQPAHGTRRPGRRARDRNHPEGQRRRDSAKRPSCQRSWPFRGLGCCDPADG